MSFSPNPSDVTVLGGLGTPQYGASYGYTGLLGSVPAATFTVEMPTIPSGVNAIRIGGGCTRTMKFLLNSNDGPSSSIIARR